MNRTSVALLAAMTGVAAHIPSAFVADNHPIKRSKKGRGRPRTEHGIRHEGKYTWLNGQRWRTEKLEKLNPHHAGA